MADVSDSKQIRGYCMYDWGKSAFETSVTTAILPAWFAYLFLEANGLTTVILGAEMASDAIWSFTAGIAALVVAVVAPAFGIIADRARIKMRMLRIMTYLGAGATVLFAVAPIFGLSFQWVWLMLMFFLANIGLNGAGVFYNAILPHLGDESQMDDISNRAYAYGYLGGGILLLLHLVLLFSTDFATWATQAALATSGFWWFGFALYTFAKVEEPEIEEELDDLSIGNASKVAFSELKKTFIEIKQFKTLFLYMVAYFFFIDGINSVTGLAGIFGPVVLGLTMGDLILTILIIQFVAAPTALAFTKLADVWGTKKALSFSLGLWCVVIVGALSFAPLALDAHEDYQIQLEASVDVNIYSMTITDDLFSEGEKTEELYLTWIDEIRYGDEGASGNISTSDISSFFVAIEETRFSASVRNGSLDGMTVIGVEHPTNLGDGKLDFIPVAMRDNVWAPLGVAILYQWLILGCMAGALLGGSQGLARSLFGKMVPQTRSAEFFGFFGFFGKVASLMGPFMYGTLAIIYDSRTALASIALLIVIGAVMMAFVDVEDGIAVANAADEAARKDSGD